MRERERERERERDDGMKHMKIDTSSIYLVSFQNPLFDVVSLYICVIFMFLEKGDIKYKQKDLFIHVFR